MTVARMKELLEKYPNNKILVTYDDDGETLLEIASIGYLGKADGTYDKQMPFFGERAEEISTINLNQVVYVE